MVFTWCLPRDPQGFRDSYTTTVLRSSFVHWFPYHSPKLNAPSLPKPISRTRLKARRSRRRSQCQTHGLAEQLYYSKLYDMILYYLMLYYILLYYTIFYFIVFYFIILSLRLVCLGFVRGPSADGSNKDSTLSVLK